MAVLVVVVCVVLTGAVADGRAAESRQGSFWYAVDNIREAAEGARILLWVTLPPAWHGQEVEIGNIEPAPAAVLEDPATGNTIIEWVADVPARWDDPEIPPTHRFFHFDFEFTERPVRFAVDPAAVEAYDRTSDLFRRFTAPETWIQTDGKILDQARAIVGEEKNPWRQGGLIFDWLVDHLAFTPGGEGRRDALSVLTDRAGDCGQFSNLFVALCRSIGIPARTVTYAWTDGGIHEFAEAFMPGFGWIPADVSLGQMLGPDGGGMTQEEVASFLATRQVDGTDPRWFFGHLAAGRLITGLGNNHHIASPTLGRRLTFQQMKPGGIDASPAAVEITGLNGTVIQGGFFVFDQEVPDDDAAHVLVHQRLASSFFRVGLYDVVEDSCRKSLARTTDDIQSWMNMGKVYMHKGEYYKAEAAFKRAISGVALSRNDRVDALVWTHNYLGNCYDLLGHRDMALEEYRTVLEIGNNARGAVDYATKYLERPFKDLPDDAPR